MALYDDAPTSARDQPAYSALCQAQLYGILDLGYVNPAKAPPMLEQMLAGGVQVVQLRAKGYPAERLLGLAHRCQDLCSSAGVPFIINDYPELVAASGACGVHIGQDDGPLEAARQAAGPSALVGRSTHSLPQALAALREGADYLGFGPLFATPTKPDYTPIGTQEIQHAYAQVAVPVFCIGGIKRENLAGVLAAGARRVVIVSGILKATDPAAYCREVRALLEEYPLTA